MALRLGLKLMVAAGVSLAVTAVGVLVAIQPQALTEERVLAFPVGDAARGDAVFWASGCASCHAAPSAKDDAKLVLAGGLELKTDFGTFVAPNISPSAQGIGDWGFRDFANAMLKGSSPGMTHYYPSFPYNSYQKMSDQDVADLWEFMRTLPQSDNVPAENALNFPFSIRMGAGVWKALFMDASPRVSIDTADAKLARGQYLVEGPGHCGECHTPRNALGGFLADAWLGGAKNPDGEGRIPNITPGAKEVGAWSEGEIVDYLATGFTPEFDSVGGSMVSVQQNMAKLPKSDLEAIAAYLKAVPAVAESQ
jgi:mono/diheme cytochrome c family protein